MEEKEQAKIKLTEEMRQDLFKRADHLIGGKIDNASKIEMEKIINEWAEHWEKVAEKRFSERL